MSIVRDVSVSWAELKLVTVLVARPRHRSTVEEPGLRAGAELSGRCGLSQEDKLGGTTGVRGQETQVAFGVTEPPAWLRPWPLLLLSLP